MKTKYAVLVAVAFTVWSVLALIALYTKTHFNIGVISIQNLLKMISWADGMAAVPIILIVERIDHWAENPHPHHGKPNGVLISFSLVSGFSFGVMAIFMNYGVALNTKVLIGIAFVATLISFMADFICRRKSMSHDFFKDVVLAGFISIPAILAGMLASCGVWGAAGLAGAYVSYRIMDVRVANEEADQKSLQMRL